MNWRDWDMGNIKKTNILDSKTELQLISDQGILLKLRKRESYQELRQLYLARRGKNTPEMSQGELIDDTLGDEY